MFFLNGHFVIDFQAAQAARRIVELVKVATWLSKIVKGAKIKRVMNCTDDGLIVENADRG